MLNFWHSLPQPIVGLAPMDGVTDAAYRYIVARYGKPDVQFTEFVSVEEISRGTASAWRQLQFLDIERPVVAQIYGTDPEKFYQAAYVVCALGFDGVDINMGCPSKNVSSRGCGAALIKTPSLAQELIRAVQAGVRDWAGGHDLTQIGLNPRVVERVQPSWTQGGGAQRKDHRGAIPVSVKTRLGYDTMLVEEWTATLLETQPAVITLHGRTLAQMYRGQADWQAIGRAGELARGTSTLILGNGDVQTLAEAHTRIASTKVHGVLIGRGALGNPWIFRDTTSLQQPSNLAAAATHPIDITWRERCNVALEHAQYFESLSDRGPFVTMRKHLGWYCRGFPGAAEMRATMFKTTSAADVARVFGHIDAGEASAGWPGLA